MLDKTKVLNGPFTITGKTDTVEDFSYEGLKKDAITINTEDEVEELEDHTTELTGRSLTVEVTLSELDSTDLAAIADGIGSIEIDFPNKSKKITITDPDEVRPKVDNGKTKITIKKYTPGDTWPFTIGASA